MEEDDEKDSNNPLSSKKEKLTPLSIPPLQPKNGLDIVNNNTNDPTNNNKDETNTNEKQTENEQNTRKPTLSSSSVSNNEKDLQLEDERRKLRSQRFSNRRTKKAGESTEPADLNNTRESPRHVITPRSNTHTNQNQNSTPRRPNDLPSLPPTKNESTPNQNNGSNENNISSENMAQMSGLGRLSARRTRMKKPSETYPETEKSENESDNQQNRQEKKLNADNNNTNNNNFNNDHFNNTNINLPNSQNSPQVNEEMRRSALLNTSQSEMISSNGIPYPTLPSPHVNTFSNTRLQPSKRNEILFVESSDGKFKKMNKSTADRRNVGFELEDDVANTNKWDGYIDSRESFLSSFFMLVQGFMAGFSILQLYICYIASPPGNSMLSFLSYYSYLSSMVQHTYFLFSTLCLLSALNKYANDKRFNTPITPFNSQPTLIQTVPYRTITIDIILIVCYSIVFFSCIIIARTEDLFYYTQLSSPNWFNAKPVVFSDISQSQINTFHAFNILRILGSVIAWVLIVKESKTKNTHMINPVFSQSATTTTTTTTTKSPLIQTNTIHTNTTQQISV